MRRKNKTAFKQRYMRATRQKLISNNEDKAFSVLHRSTRKSLKQIYLPSFLESNNMSLGHWSPRCTAVDKSFRAGLTYAQRISPVKRREGEKEERKMTKLKEERERGGLRVHFLVWRDKLCRLKTRSSGTSQRKWEYHRQTYRDRDAAVI